MDKLYKNKELLIILVFAFIFRVTYWHYSPLSGQETELYKPWPDEGTYFSVARYILDNGFFEYLKSNYSVIVAPGNPIYLSIIFSLSKSINFIRFLNILISVASIYIVYLLGLKLFNRRAGLIAAFFCSTHYQLIQYSSTLLTEPIFFFQLLIGLYVLVSSLKSSHHKLHLYSVTTGVLLAFSALTRSIMALYSVFLVFFVFVVICYEKFHKIKSNLVLHLKISLIAACSCIFILSLVVVKNLHFFDRPIIATGSGAALWLGSRVDTEGDEPPYRGLEYDTKKITREFSHISVEGDQLLLEAAKTNIVKNKEKYALMSVKKIGRLLIGSNLAWFYPHKNLNEWSQKASQNNLAYLNMIFQLLLSSIVLVFGLVGIFLVRYNRKFHFAITSTFLYLILFSIPFLAIQRYGLSLVILLAISSGGVLDGVFSANRFKYFKLSMLLLFLCVAFVFLIISGTLIS